MCGPACAGRPQWLSPALTPGRRRRAARRLVLRTAEFGNGLRLLLGLLRLLRADKAPMSKSDQGPRALVATGSGSNGQLCEIGGGSPVNLRHGVGVMPQRGGPAA